LLGFYDPCMGERKTLRIQYLFRSKLHEITVSDAGGVIAPLRGKLLVWEERDSYTDRCCDLGYVQHIYNRDGDDEWPGTAPDETL
jgi:hypothetical protein